MNEEREKEKKGMLFDNKDDTLAAGDKKEKKNKSV